MRHLISLKTLWSKANLRKMCRAKQVTVLSLAQSKFDKDFPIVIGNAEYNVECELLRAMDLVIATSGMEETFIKYLLDVVGCSAVLSFLTDYPHF